MAAMARIQPCIYPASAMKPMPWLSKPCGLEPLNGFGYRYVHCDDTTDSRSLNRLLALHLDRSPEFDKYRQYRKWEKPFLVGTTITVMALGVDIVASNFSRALCVVFSGKRIQYQDFLVAGYNRKFGNVP